MDGRDYLLDPRAIGVMTDWLGGGGAAPPLDMPARLRPFRDHRLRQAQSLVRRHGKPLEVGAAGLTGGQYLNVGHHALTERRLDRLRSAGLRTVVMVHDTIPLDHPQFSGWGSPQRHRAFLNAARGADLVLANSHDTAARLRRHLAQPRAHPPGHPLAHPPAHPQIVAAPLGIAPVPAGLAKSGLPEGAASDPEPRFLCVGTIEPRKNHQLLLDVWARLGPAAPRLDLIGRRGWGNQAVLRRLDRDPAIGRTVHELGPVGDADRAARMAGARALVFPSLAEGFGLPVAEALALGTPVLAADLPALREVGGDVPEYLPPHDVGAWCAAIRAYAGPSAPRRDAQLERLAGWRRPSWDTHFAIVGEALNLALDTAPDSALSTSAAGPVAG